eukprot:CCRYP_013744-RA/>CCRYP_013744-RA protein AED:0.39 eAED:0.64 QI:0/0/0/1/0/0/3/0/222
MISTASKSLLSQQPDTHVQTLKTYTCKHPWTDTNTCKFMLISSQMPSRIRTNSGIKSAMAKYIHENQMRLLRTPTSWNLGKQTTQKMTCCGRHTPGLFKDVSRRIQFSLVVDDFGIKYQGKQHLDHLIMSTKHNYDFTVDYTGSLYCGITLDWHYDKGYLDISMPGYFNKQLIKYKHPPPPKPVNTPWEPYPIKFGKTIQSTLPHNDSPPLDKKQVKRIQQI